MSTPIFIDKENGDIGTAAASKNRLRLLSVAPSKAVVEKSHPKTPLAGRAANVNSATIYSVKKALGNGSTTLTSTKHQIPKGKKFVPAKKVAEYTGRAEDCSMATEDCPEKENFFPCNPLDFESFEVPEEHRLSHLSLIGVPLMTFENTSESFQSMIHITGKPPSVSWDFDTLQLTTDFLATFDEIVIDLPPPP
ncbi:securin [Heteronotia binoei]|uniref:securin n=1 Tax=Heteronotia binoei TaxID=13085 RepID=UPI002931B03E|nr:securin [Heteronotia binoei]XP_060096625.1 securin [Heteronotia binoei]XP_060096626.1 securin [Heteronotia binoei]XP_060096627.1 securin [Heteronotia binoei]XP_060096628.1 securin [Heteronotia binoei]XP_060096629.1 securin [Heteronotia binoei]XP_060096630.1 securin [Heteronotia binoei]XP_060096631.1 securin [Heteronotia binoei]